MDSFQIPEIRPESIKKVDEQFGDVESRLHGASSDKNKIGDDVFDNLKSGKDQSLSSMAAAGAQTKSIDVFTKSPQIQEALRGQLGSNSQIGQIMDSQMRSSGASDGTYRAPAISGVDLNPANYSNIEDVNQLTSLFSDKKAKQGEIGGAISKVSNDGKVQIQTNQGLAKSVQNLGSTEKMYGAKEVMYAGMEKTFKGIGVALRGASKALSAAAKGIDAASQAVDAASQAVNAIPIVGQVISAILKAIAAMLKALAKAIEAAAKSLDAAAKNMDKTAENMKTQKEQMKVKKTQTAAQKVVENNKLQKGMQRFDQINKEKEKLYQAQNANFEHQTALQGRLAELGEDVSISRPAAAQEEGGSTASLGSLGQLMQSGIGGMGGLSLNPMQGASDGAAGIGMGLASMGSMVSAITSGLGAGLLGGGLSGGGLFGGGLSGQGQGGFSPLMGLGGGLQGAGAQPSLAAGGAQPAPGGAPANSPLSGLLGQQGSPMAAQGQQKRGKLKAAQMADAAATPKVKKQGKKDYYEEELKRLAASVTDRKGENQEDVNARKADRRNLSLIYSQLNRDGVKIDPEVEKQAVAALEESGEKGGEAANVSYGETGEIKSKGASSAKLG